MHATADSRLFLKWMIAGSGSVIVVVMPVVGQANVGDGGRVNIFKYVSVFLTVIAICGCDRGLTTPPDETNNSAPARTKSAAPVDSTEWNNSIGMKFKLIPAGTFKMGSDFAKPQPFLTHFESIHQVKHTRSFLLGSYEVTQDQYRRVMGENPSEYRGLQNPVERVSWDDAVEFCHKLSELPEEKAAGNVYRLPTEAEWEYACRAGTETEYCFGSDISQLGDYAWSSGNSGDQPHPVGQKKPNAWGMYDMHGNVSEWCQDWHGQYASGLVVDPKGPTTGEYRVTRGGSWCLDGVYCRSAARLRYDSSFACAWSGFRVVLEQTGK